MLNTDFINKNLPVNGIVNRVYYYKETPSTNDTAKSIPETDILVITDNQVSGKGRQGRKWITEPGKNLTFSIKKKIPLKPGENQVIIFFFTYYLCLFIENAIQKSQPAANAKKLLQIKWPNDILFNGKKICGILVESVLSRNEYIIGIGLNVNQSSFTSGSVNASSLKNITGSEFDLNSLLVSLLGSFSDNMGVLDNKNFENLYKNWKDRANILGLECNFSIDGKNSKTGIINNLCYDGGIEILSENKIFKFYSGEIKLSEIRPENTLTISKIT